MKGTGSLHSCKRVTGGSGAGGVQVYRGAPEMVLPLRRFAIFGLGCSPGRHRVLEGDSGRLRDTILESPRIILELSGGHVGALKGHV